MGNRDRALSSRRRLGSAALLPSIVAGCLAGSGVTGPPLYIYPAQVEISEGDTVRLVVDLRDADRGAVGDLAWSSSDTVVATVDSTGLVHSHAPGVTTITVAARTRYGTAAVRVDPAILVGAGDIANCGLPGKAATESILSVTPGIVFTAGDNAYPSGSAADYKNCYDPTWGRERARTRPSPGNHEYLTDSGGPYYAYFGKNAGDSGVGYYSYEVGAWHVISLNSNVSVAPGSPQESWLRADLGAHPARCTLAYWHYPLFSQGPEGSIAAMKPLWQALYDSGADVVINGHDHNYQRYAPQTPNGVRDTIRGIREFVVGTGGSSHYGFPNTAANLEVRDSTSFGVLKLTLHEASYDWVFVPAAGGAFTDRGSARCH